MENGTRHEDVFPIEHGDIPAIAMLGNTRGYIFSVHLHNVTDRIALGSQPPSAQEKRLVWKYLDCSNLRGAGEVVF